MIPPKNVLSKPCTAFGDNRLLSAGPLIEVALAVKTAVDLGSTETILVFDDVSGDGIDFDLRGTKADIIVRLSQASFERARKSKIGCDPQSSGSEDLVDERRSRGRPKLGVVPREVTLLPRHWEWLAAQQGGASVTLRRLVEEAKRAGGSERMQRRAAHEAAYKFMAAIAGDLPGFEEATRALFADNAPRFNEQVAAWPDDVRTYATKLAFAGPQSEPADRHKEMKS